MKKQLTKTIFAFTALQYFQSFHVQVRRYLLGRSQEGAFSTEVMSTSNDVYSRFLSLKIRAYLT